MPNLHHQRYIRYQIIILVVTLSLLSIGTSRWTLMIHTMKTTTTATMPRNVLNSFVNVVTFNHSTNTVATPASVIYPTTSSTTSDDEAVIKSLLPIKSSSSIGVIVDPASDSDNKLSVEINVKPNHACFYAFNSKAWLEGRRIGNIPVPEEWLDHMMQPAHTLLSNSTLHVILSQTLCYATGRFRNVSTAATMLATKWNASNTQQQVGDWQFRLLYVAIHRLFHKPALAEYQVRRRLMCSTTSINPPPKAKTTSSVGSSITTSSSIHPSSLLLPNNYDYECPKAKFLVITLNAMGMGATFRNGAIPAMYMAVATGRIPLFIQTASTFFKDGITASSFPLVSCERRDLQCVFLPTSPCVLLWDDVRNATILNKDEERTLKRFGVYLNKDHADARVLLYHASSLSSMKADFQIHYVFHEVAHQAMMDLLQEWKTTWDAREAKRGLSTASTAAMVADHEALSNVLSAAVDLYGSQNATTWRTRNMRVFQFYLMRPNPRAQHEIDKQLVGAMSSAPSTTTGTPSKRQYYGLPIRGSDKCFRESTCLSFSSYMELMSMQRQQYGLDGTTRATILLTSEDTSILPMRLDYARNTSFPFDFIVNEQDVQPGTGRASQFQEKADAIMLSSLTAIKLQLQANVLVGNCCSNFHTLLFAFARDGCGADPNMRYECLDRMDNDARFKICCAWTRTDECNAIRTKYYNSRKVVTAGRPAKRKHVQLNATFH